MNIKKEASLSQDENELVFVVEDIDVALANSLRRAMIENVPTMAIEDVEIRQNSTIIYDEMIAHRLGLTVLTTDLDSYELAPDDGSELSAKHICKFSLKAKGPGYVYASDLKFKDPKIKPVYPKTIIAKLLEGQELIMEGSAQLGFGKVHAKWSPGNVRFMNYPEITVNQNAAALKEYKDMYPPAIFDKSGKIDKDALMNPVLLDACDGINENIIKISYKNDSFIFFVESWGQLEPKQIVKQALETLNTKTDEFMAALKE